MEESHAKTTGAGSDGAVAAVSTLGLFRLEGRRALVTASSQGIGRAIALALAEAGAEVAVHGIEAGGAENAAEAVRAAGARAYAFTADFAEPGAAASLAMRVEEALGGVDILVSNAAVQVRAPWDRMDPRDVERQLRVNLLSALDLFARLVPPMAARGWGRVLAVGSVQAARPHPEMVVYAATKAAQANLVVNLARQVAAQGVTVNEIAPGAIATARNAESLADPEYTAAVLARIPAGRVGLAEECAGAALLLCSDAGRYITGATLPVDGGMRL